MIFWLFLLAGLLPSYAAAIYYLALIVVRLLTRCGDPPPAEHPTARLAVVIPAHDEAAGISRSLESCAEIDYPANLRRVVVVADNCRDETAEIARQLGVEVWERHDESRRGKGQALAWAFARLLREAIDAIVVLDADCRIDTSSLRIVDSCLARGDQALQLNHQVVNPDSSPISYVAAVGRALEYDLFYAPKSALGLSVFLVGTGMVFHRKLLEQIAWDAESCAEDTEYSHRLAEARQPIRFVSDVQVQVEAVESRDAMVIQRRRWAEGNLRLARGHAVADMLRGLLQKNRLLFDFGWTRLLVSRPLVFLHALVVCAVAVLGRWGLSQSFPAWVIPACAGLLVLFAVYLGIGVIHVGVTVRRLAFLLQAPWVIGQLVWVSLQSLWKTSSNAWERTPR